MDKGKQDFLEEFGDDYGYPNGPKSIDQIRATEFKRLDSTDGVVYLDHAGATLYSELQMEAILKELNTSIYGNPHSQSEFSSATSDIVREARQKVLDYCNASPKEYKCIFTSGVTAALKLVGECFPWSCQSSFMYTMENHNSVLGIREYALSQGAVAFAIDIEEGVHHGHLSSSKTPVQVIQHPIQRRYESIYEEENSTGNNFNLFAFPLECNFTGMKFSLDLVMDVKEEPEKVLEGSPHSKGSWMVLIDGAKGCATEPPDLSKHPADFVVMSFYKLFGYPTGLGALIIRNDAAKLLKKTYFSGGTVAASIADIDFVKRREGIEELFEDGTVSFLSIASIHHGFKILNSLGVPAIRRHTMSLASYTRKKLLSLRHENEAEVCMLYGSHKSKVFCLKFGPTVTFNLKRPDGSWFGYREVEKLASLMGIQLRTGCFCNPGACAKYLGLSHLDLLSNIEAGHVCWDDFDIVNGKPTGAVRVSFGYMSTYEDAKKLIDFVSNSFILLPHPSQCVRPLKPRCFQEAQGNGIYLKSITIFPIKSCGGFTVDSWPLSSTGLQHDREWLLKSLNGDVLTQKKVPEMSLISTSIDLHKRALFVESPRCEVKLQIDIESNAYCDEGEELDMQMRRYEVLIYNAEINSWFSTAIGRPCSLFRCSSAKDYLCLNQSRTEGMCRDNRSKLSFANEAQFLLISERSVADLNNRLISRYEIPDQVNPMRFRPNIVVSGGEPYAEDGWRGLEIGNNDFTSLGGCNRCQMINFIQQDGQLHKSKEPLTTLASYRRVKGKIIFGILLRYEKGDKTKQGVESWLQVGQEVVPKSE